MTPVMLEVEADPSAVIENVIVVEELEDASSLRAVEDVAEETLSLACTFVTMYTLSGASGSNSDADVAAANASAYAASPLNVASSTPEIVISISTLTSSTAMVGAIVGGTAPTTQSLRADEPGGEVYASLLTASVGHTLHALTDTAPASGP